MKKITYWAPCLDKVGTYKAVINSALSLSKYSSDLVNISIVNACGEWDDKKDFFKKNNIKVIDLAFSYFRFLPKTGYLGSRFSYLIISLISIFPLIRFLIKYRPSYFIGHLITSLPLVLFGLFNFNSKFVLRISGYPKLNLFRRYLWKNFSYKIYKVTSPSKDLQSQLIQSKLFKEDKITFLPDPIINLKEILRTNDKIKAPKKKFFISVGRLTKQKNFNYLIDEFSNFSQNRTDYNLLIFGEGENKESLKDKINRLNLNDKVFLMGFSENIYSYMKKAEAFILSSLWEDPGFVIVEAALCNLFVISSDCKNGPKEFLLNGEAGILYTTNQKQELKNSLENFQKLSVDKLNSMKIKAKKNCKKYSLLRHHNYFKEILFKN
tara:strand:- start:2659 stop:3798 length:1140 start_codon:yes stop_codon:yes gene_type:complete